MSVSEQTIRERETRFFGNCPACDGLDGLVISGCNSRISCELCGVSLNDGVYEQRGLSRATLEKDTMDVTLLEPSRTRIPFASLIDAGLNSALIEKFNLEPYLEGREEGVCGYIDGKPWDYVALFNKKDFVGVQVKDPRMGLSASPVLDFYHRLLKRLVLEPVEFAGYSYQRGEILKLPKPQKINANVLFSLAAAVNSIGGQEFRKRVFDRLNGSFPLALIEF